MASKREVRLAIPSPLEHQRPHLDDPARFKVGRCGRRWGKTWNAYTVSCRGHGPIVTPELDGVGQGAVGERMWKGVAQGGRIAWISRDFTQLEIIWRELWRPRWKGRPGIRFSEKDYLIEVQTEVGGSFIMRSAENVDSLRGSKLHGAICDEAAHWDLERGWREVIRPALADYRGWSWIVSTTMLASFFNELCQALLDGSEQYPAGRWYHFHGTVDDNPKIAADEKRELRNEYVEGSIEEAQELDAKLVVEGGMAFPMFREAVHVQEFEVPHGWVWAAGLDWGYSNPGAFTLSAFGPDREEYVRWAWSFRETAPYDVGYDIGVKLTGEGWPCSYIVADDQMWYRSEGPLPMAERFRQGLADAMGKMAPSVVQAVKGPGSAKHRFMLATEALRYRVPDGWDGVLPPDWAMPRTTFHPEAAALWGALSKLRRDPHDVEKVAKEDNNDHPYDAWTYLESYRRPRGERQHEMNEGVELGPTKPRRRRKPEWLAQAERRAKMVDEAHGRFVRRYGA